MLLGLFRRAEKQLDNTVESLREGLLGLHTASKEKLHKSHPHIKKILEKHNIDPEKIRQAAPKVLVASALLGAFLAYPHLFGKPYTSEEGKIETAAHVTVAKKPVAKESTAKSQEANGAKKDEGQANGSSAGQVSSGTENTGKENNESEEGQDEEINEEKSQGHIYGRSAMAPPKDHGLHDLGLHKGEENNPDNPEKGEHPEELDVVHNESAGKNK